MKKEVYETPESEEIIIKMEECIMSDLGGGDDFGGGEG